MPLVTRYDTPAGLRDLPEDSKFYEAWHEVIDNVLGDGQPGTDGTGDFYNAARKDVRVVAERLTNWMGFPRPLLMTERDNRQKAFEEAEVRRDEKPIQGEYFEWFVTRNGAGKIKKVTFVTETRLYWEQLFKFDRERVLALYHELVSPDVTMADLVDKQGNYNSYNAWNIEKGIVHYIVGINSIEAANRVTPFGVSITDSPQAKDGYDSQARANTPLELFSADNRMLFDVNAFARKGFSMAFRDPIGLYITDWDDTGWTKPDGSPVGNYWRIVRGKPGMALRLEYEVPESEGFMVSDISIGGRPVKYGGHLAEHITVMMGISVGKPV